MWKLKNANDMELVSIIWHPRVGIDSCCWEGKNRMGKFCRRDPQNFGGKFNPRHKSEPEGWVGKWRMWESRLGGELARVPASRVDVPVVIRIHLQGAMDFLYCKDVAPGPAVGKWEALVRPTRRGENRFGTPKAGQPWLPQQCSLHSEWTSARSSVVKTKPRKSSCTKEKESGQLGRREPHTSRKPFQKGVCGQ